MNIDTSKLYHPQDAVKLAYQAAFGAEHLLFDMQKARMCFNEEYAGDLKPAPLVEKIAQDVVRVNLAAWKEANLPSDWLFDLFVLSCMPKNENQNEQFFGFLHEIEELAKSTKMLFSYEEWSVYINIHGKIGPVRHSEEYRKKEKPAYRIISGFFVRLIPILYEMRGRQNAVIGIDGRAASGKSTMADGLAKIFGGVPISMDDFFLPNELRTSDRLDEPGGNVHYERFAKEVVPKLQGNQAIIYRPFNCKKMIYDEPKTIPITPFMVIEGAYSHLPYFGEYLDTKVFSDVSPKLQMERIKKRNGESSAEVFKNKWIPLEEKYFKTYKIKENVCLVV